ITLEEAELAETGLAHDREWMLVDSVGRFVTQRELPAMATISAHLDADRLRLEHPSRGPLCVPLGGPDALRERPRRTVYVWQDACQALDEGDEASDWLTAVLGDLKGSRLRLVRFAPEHRRAVEADFLGPGELAHTRFADGYPLLIVNTASLDALNEQLLEQGLDAVPMSRFRPSLVVDGEPAFAEVGWAELTAESGVRLGLRKPSQRCKIITQDQRTGETPVPREPLRSLMLMNTQPGWRGAFFGQNAIVLSGASTTLRVGERLAVR
ncbi:MAG TPA: MOSC N-terminal beta barrel domain-containing protein, partial [Wenzhouxiangella sp.]|nr:MOSC N-terminal beta barrel domain-containing protein [Wenzhouxiangella sp.]